MIADSVVEIDAPPTVVWDVFTDVERWPEWTASVTRLVALDGPRIAVGKRFEIKQPRMPRLVWEVTEVTPGAAWTWVQRSPGGLTLARHDVIPEADSRTRVRQQIDQRGPVGAFVGLLMRGMTKRYLELEAAGLKTDERDGRLATAGRPFWYSATSTPSKSLWCLRRRRTTPKAVPTVRNRRNLWTGASGDLLVARRTR